MPCTPHAETAPVWLHKQPKWARVGELEDDDEPCSSGFDDGILSLFAKQLDRGPSASPHAYLL